MISEKNELRLLSVPAIFALAVLTVIPVLILFALSFTEWSLIVPGSLQFSFTNYAERMFSDDEFVKSLSVTFYYIVVNSFFQITLGFTIAFLLFRYTTLKFFRPIIIVPMLVPPAVVGIIFKLLFIPNLGGLDYYLGILGAPVVDWLSHPETALIAVSIAAIWEWTPFCIIVFLAGLESLPRSPLESAVIDGANTFHIIFYIILPLLKPLFYVVIILRIIESLAILPLVMTMTGGGPANATQAINLYAFQVGINMMDIGYAASILVFFMFIILIMTTPIIISSLKKEYE